MVDGLVYCKNAGNGNNNEKLSLIIPCCYALKSSIHVIYHLCLYITYYLSKTPFCPLGKLQTFLLTLHQLNSDFPITEELILKTHFNKSKSRTSWLSTISVVSPFTRKLNLDIFQSPRPSSSSATPAWAFRFDVASTLSITWLRSKAAWPVRDPVSHPVTPVTHSLSLHEAAPSNFQLQLPLFIFHSIYFPDTFWPSGIFPLFSPPHCLVLWTNQLPPRLEQSRLNLDNTLANPTILHSTRFNQHDFPLRTIFCHDRHFVFETTRVSSTITFTLNPSHDLLNIEKVLSLRGLSSHNDHNGGCHGLQIEIHPAGS